MNNLQELCQYVPVSLNRRKQMADITVLQQQRHNIIQINTLP